MRFQLAALSIDAVGHHQPNGNARRVRLLDEGPGQRGLGRKGRILRAQGQAPCRSIGPDAERDLAGAVGPLTGHRNAPARPMPQLAQILLSSELNAVAAFGIAGLIDDEHARRVRPEDRMGLPELEPALVERLAVPGGVMEQVVQGLPARSRDDAGKRHQRLVVFARQQQTNQVLAQRLACFVAGEQLIAVGTQLVDRLARRRRGFAWSRHGVGMASSSSGAGDHGQRRAPSGTNCTLSATLDQPALEDLPVRILVRNHHLAKSISDAGWAVFRTNLTFKAAWAGKRVEAVPAQYTSQEDCSGCGKRVPKRLSVRTHICPSCGLVLDRDENAAKNILRAGQARQGAVAVAAVVN